MSWVRRLLTKRIIRETSAGRRLRVEEIPPSERLVMLFQFSLVAMIAMTVLEIAHLALLGVWNSEIFAAITGLVGTVMGIIIGARK